MAPRSCSSLPGTQAVAAYNCAVCGKTQRYLSSFLRLGYCFCRCLEINPVEVLCPSVRDTSVTSISDTSPQRRLKKRALVDYRTIEMYLQDVLRDTGSPPPSMREVGRKLKRDARHIQELFPQESRAISARFLSCQQEQRQRRISDLVVRIQQTVRELHNDGTYPSQELVARTLGRTGGVWAPEACAAWRAAMSELGYRV